MDEAKPFLFYLMSGFSLVSKRKILIKSNCRCFYCGEDLNSNKWEIDHIDAFSKSGNGTTSNLVASCIHCNRIKSDFTIERFRQILQTIYDTPIEFFFEKYGIMIEKDGSTFTNTLNKKTFDHVKKIYRY